MTRDPEEIREEIEETREELADTAAALAYKTDVKARAKERVGEVKEKVPPSPEAIRRNKAPIAAVAGAALFFALGYLAATRRT